MLTVFLVTAEANLGEGKTEQIALLSAHESVFVLRELKLESLLQAEARIVSK